MSTKVRHTDIDWPQVLLSAALASATSTFLLAGEVRPNMTDLLIGIGILVGAELTANYILYSLTTRHQQ